MSHLEKGREDADDGLQDKDDVFGDEANHGIVYKTLSWQLVALLMICEIVSNGILSLPYSVAATGLVPSVIVITFLGVFATYTGVVLVNFKLRHPSVHTMGDAGYILFGPVGREIFAFGTIAFAIFGTGSQLLAGNAALSSLSDGKLCGLIYTGIMIAVIFVLSFPRTLDQLGWLSVIGVIGIVGASVVGMIGAGLYPVTGFSLAATVPTTFLNGFTAVTNPVFSYAGHFLFFALISEMKQPKDASLSHISSAIKAVYVLQGTATTLYVLFAVISYIYLGPTVASPSLISLQPKWAKAAFGLALVNFIVAGAIYSHFVAKLFFVRIFRGKKDLHENTIAGWVTWSVLIILANGAAFVLAVGIPVFNYVVGLAAALFAAWYTYGIAGMFWLHDAYHDHGLSVLSRKGWTRSTAMHGILSVFTILAGAFMCVAGLYVTIQGIIIAYQTGQIVKPFSCN